MASSGTEKWKRLSIIDRLRYQLNQKIERRLIQMDKCKKDVLDLETALKALDLKLKK